MSDVKWIVPRHFYQSYTHLYKLIELAGYEMVYPEQIEWESDNCYILTVLNGEMPDPLPARKCKVIWSCIERPSVYNEPLLGRPDFDELWICDKDWANRMGARFFLMGSDSRLGYYEPSKRYDIATNCYETGRREVIFNSLRANGLKFSPNSFNIPDSEFAASKIQVLPQQDDPPHSITPLRFCIAAAYHMPMVFELEEVSSEPFESGRHFVRSGYGSLVDLTFSTLEGLHGIGHNLHDFLCIETNFRKSVEAML